MRGLRPCEEKAQSGPSLKASQWHLVEPQSAMSVLIVPPPFAKR